MRTSASLQSDDIVLFLELSDQKGIPLLQRSEEEDLTTCNDPTAMTGMYIIIFIHAYTAHSQL
ncbi:hypothetical protein [Methanocalculus sp.]|uniref:hypothetical protein n=1 Tax=Methanocalculus sp. TaxID=2004547 RepID=UPI002726CAA1|nr:hypothetical protein [Methanocalculus sp.]MDO8841000.1 hypothetical protein [Methanocalculus sp.]